MKLFGIILAASAASTSAHFRYGHITYDCEGNTCNFHVETAWTRDYGDGHNVNNINKISSGNGDAYHRREANNGVDGYASDLAKFGDVVEPNGLTGNPAFDFGDGSDTVNLQVTVTAMSHEENWFAGYSEFSHTYASGGTYSASYTGCCKLFFPVGGNEELGFLREVNRLGDESNDFAWGNFKNGPDGGVYNENGAHQLNADGMNFNQVWNNMPDENNRDENHDVYWRHRNRQEFRKPWFVESTVVTGAFSPQAASFPIVSLNQGADGNCFYLPAVTSDACDNTLQCSQASLKLYGGTVEQDAEGRLTLNSNGDQGSLSASGGGENVAHELHGLSVEDAGTCKICVDETVMGYPGLQNIAIDFSDSDTGATSSIDMLINIQTDETSAPEIFIDNSAESISDSEVMAYPSITPCWTGFPCDFTVGASADASVLLSFGAIHVPEGAMLSTVRNTGVASAHMDFEWTPCADDVGHHIVCFEAVDNNGQHSSLDQTYEKNGRYGADGTDYGLMRVSTQMCVHINVMEDTTPDFVWNSDSAPHMTVNIGEKVPLDLVAAEANYKDSITISPAGSSQTCNSGAQIDSLDWPIGGTRWVEDSSRLGADPLITDVEKVSLGPDVYDCSDATAAVTTATFLWTPNWNQGGWDGEICFAITDSADSSCTGADNDVVRCVAYTVRKCVYSPPAEQMLQEIASIYGMDWLQLWSMNLHIKHPDYIMLSGYEVNIGHLYRAETRDTIGSVASRFGTTYDSIDHLNNDMCGDQTLYKGVEYCLIPRAAAGKTESTASYIADNLSDTHLIGHDNDHDGEDGHDDHADGKVPSHDDNWEGKSASHSSWLADDIHN